MISNNYSDKNERNIYLFGIIIANKDNNNCYYISSLISINLK